jgi:hypothetical protein
VYQVPGTRYKIVYLIVWGSNTGKKVLKIQLLPELVVIFDRFGIFSAQIIWESHIGLLTVLGDHIGSNTGKKMPIRVIFVTSAMMMRNDPYSISHWGRCFYNFD